MKSKFLPIIISVIALFSFSTISFGGNHIPTIITQPSNQTVCAGNPASFTVTAAGATYQWRRGSVNLIDTGSISGSNTATLTINPTRVPDSSLHYNVIVTVPLQLNDTSIFVSLTVNPLPVVVTGKSDTICYGDTISIGGPPVPADKYNWTPNKGLSSYTVSNPNASPDDTTTYTLTVTDTVTGCANSDTLLIVVKPVPSAYITANNGDTSNFCAGEPLILTASNGASFLWSTGSTNKSIPVVAGVAYSVGITYLDGCSDYTGPSTVFVNPLPSADAGPTKGICKGDSTIIGTPKTARTTYSWLPATGLSSDTAAQPKASPSLTTTYTLTVTDTIKGCKNTDTVTVSVYPKPTANAGTYAVICKGDTTSIGAPPVLGVTYSWLPVAGLNSATSSQPKASPAATTTYTLTTSTSFCSSTDTVSVKVNPLPTANAGPDKTICLGDTTKIGTPALLGNTYSWSPAAGLNSTVLAQPNASPLIPTTYTLTVTNTAFSCTNTDTVLVNVLPQPVANTGTYKVICKGDTTSIGAPAVLGVSYSWLPVAGLNSATSSQPNASPVTTTTYTLTATNGTCSNTDTVSVKVNPLPVADAGLDKTICMGDTTKIGTPALLGNTYSWSPAAGLNSTVLAQPDASPLIPTTYTLTVTNTAFSCTNTDTVMVNVLPQPIANAGTYKVICKGDSTSIGAPGVNGVTYAWLPVNGLSSATSSHPNASPAITTTYTLTATNGPCSNTDTVSVKVNPLPTANAGADKNICKSDSTSIGTPAISGNTYIWSPAAGLNSTVLAQPDASPLITTTYTLTVTNAAFSCTNTDTVIVNVSQQPIANTGPDKSICKGDSVSIGAPAVNGVTYAWLPVNGLSSATSSQPNASPANTTTYTLTVVGGICSSIVTGTVVVTVNTAITANAGPDQTICKGTTVTIGTPAIAGNTYNWSPSTGLNSATASQPAADPGSTTTYTLITTNGSCSGSDSVIIHVNPLPMANAGSNQSLCDAGSVQLGGPPVAGDTYLWTPAMGLNSSSISQPTANPSQTTLYTVNETDTTTGCFNSNEVTVTIGSSDFYTGISPNGDGVNDWWNIPMLNCYTSNTVLIINRWGSEVWRGSDYDNNTVKWAGQDMNGTDLADGTYYYIIKYNNTEKRGWVYIKR